MAGFCTVGHKCYTHVLIISVYIHKKSIGHKCICTKFTWLNAVVFIMEQLFKFDHNLMLENNVEFLIFKISRGTTQVLLLLKEWHVNTVYSEVSPEK